MADEDDDEEPAQVVMDMLAQEKFRHKGPVKSAAQLEAAFAKDVPVLIVQDKNFDAALKEDPGILQEHGAAYEALGLYCATVTAFDLAPQFLREALKAVVRDDVATISKLLDERKIAWDTRNQGGQTLLELAIQRSRLRVQKRLEDSKRAQKLRPLKKKILAAVALEQGKFGALL